MADALTALRELVEAQDALQVEQRDILSANHAERLKAAMTRASKADAAARRVIAGVRGDADAQAIERAMHEAIKQFGPERLAKALAERNDGVPEVETQQQENDHA